MIEQHEISSFIKGFFLGCLVGIGCTILFAPQSGKKTRRQIQRSGKALKHQLKEGVAEVRDGVDNMVNQAQLQAEAAQEQGSKVLKTQANKLTDAAETLKEGVANLTS